MILIVLFLFVTVNASPVVLQLGNATGYSTSPSNYFASSGLTGIVSGQTGNLVSNTLPFKNTKQLINDQTNSLLYAIDPDTTYTGVYQTKVFNYSSWTSANLVGSSASNFNPSANFTVPGQSPTDYGWILRTGSLATKATFFFNPSTGRKYMAACQFFSNAVILYDVTNESTNKIVVLGNISANACQTLDNVYVNGTWYFYSQISNLTFSDPLLLVFSLNSAWNGFTFIKSFVPHGMAGMNNTQIFPVLVSGDNTQLWLGQGSVGVAVYSIINPSSPTYLASLPVQGLSVPAPGDYTLGVQNFCTRTLGDQGIIGGFIVSNNVNSIVSYSYSNGIITSNTVVVGSNGTTNVIEACWVDSITNNFYVSGVASGSNQGIASYVASGGKYSVQNWFNSCPFLNPGGLIAGTQIAWHSTEVQCNYQTGQICPLGALAISPQSLVQNIVGEYKQPYIPFSEGLYTIPLATKSNFNATVQIASEIGTGSNLACNPIESMATGALCVTFRGVCAFETKMINCLNAGKVSAVAVVLHESDEVESFQMTTPLVPVSSFVISYADGMYLISAVNSNTSTPSPPTAPTSTTPTSTPSSPTAPNGGTSNLIHSVVILFAIVLFLGNLIH
jgi:hypothetical protein